MFPPFHPLSHHQKYEILLQLFFILLFFFVRHYFLSRPVCSTKFLRHNSDLVFETIDFIREIFTIWCLNCCLPRNPIATSFFPKRYCYIFYSKGNEINMINIEISSRANYIGPQKKKLKELVVCMFDFRTTEQIKKVICFNCLFLYRKWYQQLIVLNIV